MIQAQGVTVGTCGLCGGQVTVPGVWQSIIPPVPTCEACGASVAEHGPVLPMNPLTRPVVTPAGGTGDAGLMMLATKGVNG